MTRNSATRYQVRNGATSEVIASWGNRFNADASARALRRASPKMGFYVFDTLTERSVLDLLPLES